MPTVDERLAAIEASIARIETTLDEARQLIASFESQVAPAIKQLKPILSVFGG